MPARTLSHNRPERLPPPPPSPPPSGTVLQHADGPLARCWWWTDRGRVAFHCPSCGKTHEPAEVTDEGEAVATCEVTAGEHVEGEWLNVDIRLVLVQLHGWAG